MLDNNTIFHAARRPWQLIYAPGRLALTVRAPAGTDRITCLYCDPSDTHKGELGENVPHLLPAELHKTLETPDAANFTLDMPLPSRRLRYHFVLSCGGKEYLLDGRGLSAPGEERDICPFFVRYAFESRLFSAPDWARNAVWYQIYPDSFRAPAGAPWEYAPVGRETRHGGDLAGVEKSLPYLKELGVGGIYLNPVFSAASPHRYDTVDYYHADETLGGDGALKSLCAASRRAGLRVMLDGVFNHCSSRAPQFRDVIRNGAASRYKDWFLIRDMEALRALGETDAVRFDGAPCYEAFASVPSMPKWNTENPEVADYLIGAAEYWTKKCGVDAWRLDVPDEMSMAFLRRFRARIKALDPSVYIIGELWDDATEYLSGELFDGAMDYTLYYLIRDFAAARSIDAAAFCRRLADYLTLYPKNVRDAMFGFCSNHDIPRVKWLCGGSDRSAGLCYALLAAVGGGMSVYYGDELGMTGGYDPDNRRCMPWDGQITDGSVPGDELRAALRLKRSVARRDIASARPLSADAAEIVYDDGNALAVNRGERELLCGGTLVPGCGWRWERGVRA